MKNSLLIIVLLLAFTPLAQSQIELIEKPEEVKEDEVSFDPEFENIIWDPEYFYSYRKEIALDFTPLISKLVPFNLGQTEFGLIGLKYKRYGRKMAFRVNFGSKIEFNEPGNFFYLSLGYEKRKTLTPKFTYTTGWDIFISFIEDDDQFSDEAGLGVAHFYGFEYNFNDVFYMATEAQLQIGSADGDIGIKMVVPEAIFIGARF